MSNVIAACRGIVKTYKDAARELKILQGVDMEITEGEILAISGTSGAGKSTLLHIVGTLDRPTAGEVFFRDKPILKMSRAAVNRIRNREIGFVFQFYHLLPEFSALENVMMPGLCWGVRKSAAKTRALELLEIVGLKDRLTHKPGQLSGGEQQRVAIARALFNKPALILADEPTGNLDENTGGGIIDLLWQLNEVEKITMVVVTHDDELAKKAHRWIHLHEGRAHPRK